MGCIALPHVPKPTLPLPLTLGISLSTPPLDFTLCCSIHIPSLPIIPPISATIVPTALIAALLAYVDQVNDFIDSIAPTCPLDKILPSP